MMKGDNLSQLEQEKWNKASLSSSVSDEAVSMREDHQIFTISRHSHSFPMMEKGIIVAAAAFPLVLSSYEGRGGYFTTKYIVRDEFVSLLV
jgi:hypothetical protein